LIAQLAINESTILQLMRHDLMSWH